MIAKIISGLIALAYLIFALFFIGPASAIKIAGYLVFCLGCIWFSEDVGKFTGFGMPAVTTSSTGCMVAAGGWLLLILPLIQMLIVSYAD